MMRISRTQRVDDGKAELRFTFTTPEGESVKVTHRVRIETEVDPPHPAWVLAAESFAKYLEESADKWISSIGAEMASIMGHIGAEEGG